MKINISKGEVIIIGSIGAIIVFVLPWLFVQPSIFPNLSGKGEIGDTIGGITAPFLSFFGSVLVYLALKSQIDANEEFKKQFEKQNYDQLFFRLMDKLNEQILNFEINDGSRDLRGYESLGYLVKGLKERLKNSAPSILKEYLVKLPEEVDLNTYKAILKVLQPHNNITDLQAEELKELFVKEQSHYNRQVLLNQYVVGSDRKAILKEETKKLLYIRSNTLRSRLYNDIFEKLYEKGGAFLDAYTRNLIYLIELIDQQENNRFYVDYLKGTLSDHEKAFLYYYLFGRSGDERIRNFFKKAGILDDFDYQRYTNIPNDQLFEKELEMVL